MTDKVIDPYAEDEELQAFREAQVKEYSTWVASQDIYVGNALAYRAGDPVPVSNVARHGYDKNGLAEKVARPASTTSKATKATTGDEH